MADLEILRRELLERGDEMISFQQLVERFDSVEKEFGNTPWNLKQIYSNFNILTGEKPNKWIPVSERLPEEYKKVLVSDSWSGVYVGQYIDAEESWGGKHFINEGGMHSKTVKAWQPLPEPYKASPTGAESEK